MVTRIVRTEALLPAPPERVWAVLVDFSRYCEWNPLNVSARGEARLGANVAMAIYNPLRPKWPLKMTVRITSFAPRRHLVWLGSVPMIFRGEHAFRLSPEGAGTRLHHTETITGLMTRRITEQVVAEKFVPAYEAANRALAARAASAT